MDHQLRKDLARAKALIRGEGWTVTGNRVFGYIVRQGNVGRNMTARELLEFAGLA